MKTLRVLGLLSLFCWVGCAAKVDEAASYPEWLTGCENGACESCPLPPTCSPDAILLCETSTSETCPDCTCLEDAATISCSEHEQPYCRDGVCECRSKETEPECPAYEYACLSGEREVCTIDDSGCEICKCVKEECPAQHEYDCLSGEREVCTTDDGGCEICKCEGEFAWYESCGDPVCSGHRESDLPPCTDETVGESCSEGEPSCDPGNDCNSYFVCADSDPKLSHGECPISRKAYKQDIDYLDYADLQHAKAELLSIPLATYKYKSAKRDRKNLGFIIEDVEPSQVVDSERNQVDLYAYLTMAVATLKLQEERLMALEEQLQSSNTQVSFSDPMACR